MRIWIWVIPCLATMMHGLDHNDSSLHDSHAYKDLQYINNLRQAIYNQGRWFENILKKRDDHNTRPANNTWKDVVQNMNAELDTYVELTNERYVGDEVHNLEQQVRRYSAATQLIGEVVTSMHYSQDLHNKDIPRHIFGSHQSDPVETALLRYAHMLENLRLIRNFTKKQNITGIAQKTQDINKESVHQNRYPADENAKQLQKKMREKLHIHKKEGQSPTEWLQTYIDNIHHIKPNYRDEEDVFHRWDQQYNYTVRLATQTASLLHLNLNDTKQVPFDTQPIFLPVKSHNKANQ